MGFPERSTNTAIRPGTPFGHEPAVGRYEHFEQGIRLQTIRSVVPISSVLSGDEYERHLDRLTEHHAAEEKRLRDAIRLDGADTPRPRRPNRYPIPDPEEVMFDDCPEPGQVFRWGDLRLVDCAECREPLVAHSHEWLRALAKAHTRHIYLIRRLPKPIRHQHDGKPFCEKCRPTTEDQK